MVIAKIPGVSTPCQNRQKRSWPRLAENAESSVGTASRKAAGTITRLRPARSATRPAKGAAAATANVDAVITYTTADAGILNAADSMGNSGCGAYRVRKAQKPAKTTA